MQGYVFNPPKLNLEINQVYKSSELAINQAHENSEFTIDGNSIYLLEP